MVSLAERAVGQQRRGAAVGVGGDGADEAAFLAEGDLEAGGGAAEGGVEDVGGSDGLT